MAAEEWIFTFGSGQVHPDTGESLRNCFVRIHAASWGAARDQMIRRFGAKWAFQYASEDEAGVGRYGLREIPMSEPVAGEAPEPMGGQPITWEEHDRISKDGP